MARTNTNRRRNWLIGIGAVLLIGTSFGLGFFVLPELLMVFAIIASVIATATILYAVIDVARNWNSEREKKVEADGSKKAKKKESEQELGQQIGRLYNDNIEFITYENALVIKAKGEWKNNDFSKFTNELQENFSVPAMNSNIQTQISVNNANLTITATKRDKSSFTQGERDELQKLYLQTAGNYRSTGFYPSAKTTMSEISCEPQRITISLKNVTREIFATVRDSLVKDERLERVGIFSQGSPEKSEVSLTYQAKAGSNLDLHGMFYEVVKATSQVDAEFKTTLANIAHLEQPVVAKPQPAPAPAPQPQPEPKPAAQPVIKTAPVAIAVKISDVQNEPTKIRIDIEIEEKYTDEQLDKLDREFSKESSIIKGQKLTAVSEVLGNQGSATFYKATYHKTFEKIQLEPTEQLKANIISALKKAKPDQEVTVSIEDKSSKIEVPQPAPKQEPQPAPKPITPILVAKPNDVAPNPQEPSVIVTEIENGTSKSERAYKIEVANLAPEFLANFQDKLRNTPPVTGCTNFTTSTKSTSFNVTTNAELTKDVVNEALNETIRQNPQPQTQTVSTNDSKKKQLEEKKPVDQKPVNNDLQVKFDFLNDPETAKFKKGRKLIDKVNVVTSKAAGEVKIIFDFPDFDSNDKIEAIHDALVKLFQKDNLKVTSYIGIVSRKGSNKEEIFAWRYSFVLSSKKPGQPVPEFDLEQLAKLAASYYNIHMKPEVGFQVNGQDVKDNSWLGMANDYYEAYVTKTSEYVADSNAAKWVSSGWSAVTEIMNTTMQQAADTANNVAITIDETKKAALKSIEDSYNAAKEKYEDTLENATFNVDQALMTRHGVSLEDINLKLQWYGRDLKSMAINSATNTWSFVIGTMSNVVSGASNKEEVGSKKNNNLALSVTEFSDLETNSSPLKLDINKSWLNQGKLVINIKNPDKKKLTKGHKELIEGFKLLGVEGKVKHKYTGEYDIKCTVTSENSISEELVEQIKELLTKFTMQKWEEQAINAPSKHVKQPAAVLATEPSIRFGNATRINDGIFTLKREASFEITISNCNKTLQDQFINKMKSTEVIIEEVKNHPGVFLVKLPFLKVYKVQESMDKEFGEIKDRIVKASSQDI